MKRKTLFMVFIILTVAVMSAIFFFSSQNASSSSDTSGSVVRIILSVFVRGFGDMSSSRQNELVTRYGGFIRKCAHFSEFAALGFFFTSSLLLKETERIYLKSFVFGAVYASLDEIHQLFSDGRACSPRDVLIDLSGFTAGLIVSALIAYIIERKRS